VKKIQNHCTLLYSVPSPFLCHVWLFLFFLLPGFLLFWVPARYPGSGTVLIPASFTRILPRPVNYCLPVPAPLRFLPPILLLSHPGYQGISVFPHLVHFLVRFSHLIYYGTGIGTDCFHQVAIPYPLPVYYSFRF
jgi:hypothetical protein